MLIKGSIIFFTPRVLVVETRHQPEHADKLFWLRRGLILAEKTAGPDYHQHKHQVTDHAASIGSMATNNNADLPRHLVAAPPTPHLHYSITPFLHYTITPPRFYSTTST